MATFCQQLRVQKTAWAAKAAFAVNDSYRRAKTRTSPRCKTWSIPQIFDHRLA